MSENFKQLSNSGAIGAHIDLDIIVAGDEKLGALGDKTQKKAASTNFVLSGFNGYDERAVVGTFQLSHNAFVSGDADITASMSPSGFGGELSFANMWTEMDFKTVAKAGVFAAAHPTTIADSESFVTGFLDRTYAPAVAKNANFFFANTVFTLSVDSSRVLPDDNDEDYWSQSHYVYLSSGKNEIKATFNPTSGGFWTIQRRLRTQQSGGWWDGTPAHSVPNANVWLTETVIGRDLNKTYTARNYQNAVGAEIPTKMIVGHGTPHASEAWKSGGGTNIMVAASIGLTGYEPVRHDSMVGDCKIEVKDGLYTNSTLGLPDDPQTW